MSNPANDFERRAFGSMAAEEAKSPSPWHRRWVALLAAVCLLQWAGLLYIAVEQGATSVPIVALLNGCANTALLGLFVVRLRKSGSIWRKRRPLNDER